MEANSNSGQLPSIPPSALAAVSKFFQLVDDIGAVRDTGRRIFFEFLRTNATLSHDDLDNMQAVGDLLAELEKASRELGPHLSE